MKPALSALGSGLLFGAGLGVSGMTQPSKITSFLDITGRWDPSLAFVMVGAIVVHTALFQIIRRGVSPLFEPRFYIPTRTDFDASLFIGAAVFGAGWGLSGLCPGPGLVNVGGASLTALVFVAAMTVGILLARAIQNIQSPAKTGADASSTTPIGSAITDGGSR